MEDKSQPFYIVGWHRPSALHPDDAALSALADYLGQGRTSLLYKNLVKDKKMAVSVGAMGAFPGDKYPTLFGVYAVPSKGVTGLACEEEIFSEVEKVKAEPIPEEELVKIKARAKANFINGLSSRQGLAMQLAAYQTQYGDWRQMFKELDDINAVTTADIQRVANTYLTRSNRSVGYIETVEEES